jgi:glutamate synthase domain-containing protein 3
VTFGDYEITQSSVTGANAGRFTATLKNSDTKFTTNQGAPKGDVIIDLKGSAGGDVDAVLVIKVAKQTDHNFFGEIDHPIHIKN